MRELGPKFIYLNYNYQQSVFANQRNSMMLLASSKGLRHSPSKPLLFTNSGFTIPAVQGIRASLTAG